MALKRIQDLTPAAALDGSELIELEQGGASVQCTAQDIADLASGGGGGGSGDVVGPASAVTNRIAVFDGNTGKMIKDGGTTVAALQAIQIISTVTGGAITPAARTDILRPDSLTAALTVANPSANPADGWGMVIELKDNGTARALTWGSKYASRIGTLPTTTVAGKQHLIGVSYNAAADKLYCDFAAVQA